LKITNHIQKIKDFIPGEMTTSQQALVLSTLETCLHVIGELKGEVQALKDEINRLKGEQGKPTIAAKNQKSSEDSDAPDDPSQKTKPISSEKERKKKGKKRAKKRVKFDGSVRIDREEVLDIEDKSDLPLDIEFKGYATSHYQDLEIKATLIALKRAIYYSPSTGKTYTAGLPEEYEVGQDYTQALKGHILMFKFEMGLSIPKIGDFLRMNGVDISDGTISNIILAGGDFFQQTSELIHQTGVQTGLYVQTDTTGSRVNGVNWHTHIFGNEYYSAYFTRLHKDRQTVLDIIRLDQPRIYLLNEETYTIYKYLKIPKKIWQCLTTLDIGQPVDQNSFSTQLKSVLSSEEYNKHEQKLLEGAYLAAYKSANPLHILVVDDAPQYKLLASLIVLCWVHIGRHFKKLNPTLKYHQQLLRDFLDDFWAFYHRLNDYKKTPDIIDQQQLIEDFDELFSRKTGYEHLDERIAKTRAKKKQLLVVLKHPYVPLHNNAAELDARKEVRYRDISFQTRNQKGTKTKDTFFTIIQTCKKLGVNAYAYILDQITRKKKMTPIHKVILQKANIQ